MSENSWMMLNDEVANYGCWKTSVTCQNIQTFCQIYHDSPTWKTVESVEDLPIQIAIYGFCGDRNSSPDPSELSLPDQALAQSSWPLPGACRRLLQHRKRDQRTKYLQGVEVVPPIPKKVETPLPPQKKITASNYQQNKINKKSNRSKCQWNRPNCSFHQLILL